ncbi:MAG: hypothetical protein KDD73_13865 [Anaerolineales bacterium]|nr:hypothetical protein [Anaerolineales bacterium]MCB9128695.1 hypothetical protein [Ardenticatenales bacterium]MCB9172605.1 hypothetical protein [Ardenticatenales bacterium]
MSFLGSLFGRKKNVEESVVPSNRAVLRTDGWIRVTEATLTAVQEDIESYAELIPPAKPVQFQVALTAMDDGAVAVTFPDGVTSYLLTSLIMWLDAPPQRQVAGRAMGWLISPRSGLRYALQGEPEPSDLLLGQDSQGRSVQLYVPEGTLCELSRTVAAPQEPTPPSNPPDVGHRFQIAVDVDESFGNLSFVTTHPKDTAADEMSQFG